MIVIKVWVSAAAPPARMQAIQEAITGAVVPVITVHGSTAREKIVVVFPEMNLAGTKRRVNQVLAGQAKTKKTHGHKASHLLSGYLHCHCGGKMYIYHDSLVYKCKACRNRIAEADIDEIYYLQLKSFLAGMSVEEYQDKSQQEIAERETLLKAAQSEAQKLRRQIYELVNLRIGGELSKERFAELHLPMDERLQQIDRHIPELEAEIDFRNIQRMSSDTVLQEARNLYTEWPGFSFEQKRGIVEIITEKIVVGTDEIDMTFSYLPPPKPPSAPSSQNNGKMEHSLKGAL